MPITYVLIGELSSLLDTLLQALGRCRRSDASVNRRVRSKRLAHDGVRRRRQQDR
jgi:hypothetical protein